MNQTRLPWIGSKGDLIQAAKAVRDVSREDMLEVARAIRDEMVEFLSAKMEEFFLEMERNMEKKIEERIAALEKSNQGSLGGLAELIKNMPAPFVEVTIPQPKMTRKKIQYDELGRPSDIEEREIE